ncbi:MAG: GYD domain-containing protein [Alphaproteobacteria bacterium]|nr:GYD domain-containing protein [Alphaproteobacteria bacterium]
MMTFICYLNFTEQGVKAIKDVPKRHEAAKALVQKLGGRVICTYVTTGQYDAIQVLEMPNGDTMAKFSATMAARGFVRTTTVRAFTPEEFGKLVADIKVAAR